MPPSLLAPAARGLTLLLLQFLLTPIQAFTWDQPLGGDKILGSLFGLPGEDATYDYVVVGGGLAGLVTATRLAENGTFSVAVVEAGSFYEFTNSNKSQIPWYSESSVSDDPEGYINLLIDWGLVTTPQPQLNNRRIHYAQGKTLGGSSARNQMIYDRGSKGSYDYWAELVGDESYEWDNILPFFKRSMQFNPPNVGARGENATPSYDLEAYSADGGPLQVSYPNFAMPFGVYGVEAFKAAGLPQANGFSNGDLHGVDHNPFTIDPVSQLRSSSESTFLDHAINAGSPLTVYPMTQAMRILFNNETRATGIHAHSSGMDWKIHARKEVILSAGVMHSPQLLMVSGIGPASTLHAHNITLIKDLPGVGQNMHDSCAIGAVIRQTNITNPLPITAETISTFRQNRTGILTNSGGDVLSFEKLPAKYRSHLSNATRSQLAQWPSDWPEIELLPLNRGGPTDASTGSSIAILMTATLSRGNLTITSPCMHDPPTLSPNWLLHPADQELAIQAYRRARELWNFFPGVGVDIGAEEMSPGGNVTSDARLLEYIRQQGVSGIHHASSTCMMGKAGEEGEGAVVDSKGRVFGVQGLRVVDASSFRFTPPGHTQAATYCHAEKLVEDILRGA
ncbi:alcohol oxidase [Hortaea werneckii]|nr:alcohol oxidase [Hortaea werneckii]KAI7001044.1 alcohol oxidase [Hortaea werneckii]KAI7654194.1 alcohol oxidase [Hortaea werneckii]